MSVHHHHQIVQRFGQLGGELGLLFEWLFPCEVEDILLRDIVVDNRYAIVVTDEGSHACNQKLKTPEIERKPRPTCRSSVDGVGVMSLGPSL